MTIITLEDNRDLQLFYKKIFSMWGHEVTPCLTLKEAQETLRNGLKPDLILADLTLPDANSDVLMAALQSADFTSFPVAITSGRDDLQSWGQRIGARKCFQKPVDIMQLKSFLMSLQENRGPASKSGQPEL